MRLVNEFLKLSFPPQTRYHRSMPARSRQDETHMDRCLELAQQGLGWVSPNPLVGAVVVKGGRVIGEGFHAQVGAAHAEVSALAACVESPRGATLYVNLEPCAHHGRTPPCADAIIRAGIARVVVGMRDPNPVAAGGLERLRAAGVAVTTGVRESRCRELNHGFTHFVTTGRPFIAAKVAISSDYKIAAAPGVRTRITGDVAQAFVHELRQRYDAILVGAGTVLADNPDLGVRHYPGPRPRDPRRIILDSTLRTDPSARIYRDANVLLATTRNANPRRREEFARAGVEIFTTHAVAGRVDLAAVLNELARRQITSVLVEGGREVFDSFHAAGLIQRWYVLMGTGHLGGRGVDALADLVRLRDGVHRATPRHLGADALYVCDLRAP